MNPVLRESSMREGQITELSFYLASAFRIWLFERPVDQFPEELRGVVTAARDGLAKAEIELWQKVADKAFAELNALGILPIKAN